MLQLLDELPLHSDLEKIPAPSMLTLSFGESYPYEYC